MSQVAAFVSQEGCIERQTRIDKFSGSAGAFAVPVGRWRCGRCRNLAGTPYNAMDADFVRGDASVLRRDVAAPPLVAEAV